MNMFQRVSRLITANINHLLDKAEDPEVMVKQLIREMEESIIELRRETVKAVGRQKQLEKQLLASRDKAAELESKAALALENDDELARRILARKIDVDTATQRLTTDLETARQLADRMKTDLGRLEDQVQTARRKKEELIRRKRTAEAQVRSRRSVERTHDAIFALTGSVLEVDEKTQALDAYRDKIIRMEAEAEAAEEMRAMSERKDTELEQLAREKAVEDELARLKKKIQEKK